MLHHRFPLWTVLALAGLAACRLSPPEPQSGGGQTGSTSASQGGAGAGTGGQGSSSASGGTTGSGGQTVGGGKTGTSGGASGGGSGAGGSAASGGTRSSGSSGGDAGSSGSSSATSGADASVADLRDATPPPSRGPTPAQNGLKFPFPQNRENSRCTYPKDYRNEDVQAAYDQWKKDTVTSDGAKGFRRVKRPNEPGTLEANSTVSEGIAYGMLIAVYMGDQTLFDDLWNYEQQFLDGKTGLMNWNIKADGSGPTGNGGGPATDADEDMAYALVMADKQWAGASNKVGKSYLDLAKDTITKIWNNEIFDYKYVRSWPGADNSAINLSYFAPSYYKLFAKIDTKNATNWTTTVDTMYTVLNASLNSSNGNTDNGLVPAWCDSGGKPNGGAFGSSGGPSPTNYQYDSCRVPFRIGLDWCMNGESRAQAYVAKTSKFFNNITVAKIVDGYDLNGTPHAQCQTGANAQMQSSAFIGPAGVGAMSNSIYQTFINDAYAVVASRTALVGGTYYEDSWMVMSLLMMTGNFLDYTTL
jgi:endo-1,4-beta-D-glucanase Y